MGVTLVEIDIDRLEDILNVLDSSKDVCLLSRSEALCFLGDRRRDEFNIGCKPNMVSKLGSSQSERSMDIFNTLCSLQSRSFGL